MGKKLLLLIVVVLSLIGCSAKIDPVPEDSSDNNNSVEDINYTMIVEKKEFENSEKLKEKLLTAAAIELKNTENQSLGILQEPEKITSFIEGIFTYDIEEEIKVNQQSQVIGPINFYFSDREDIYGLMNNQYIYIEGYYFVINNSIAKELQNVFKGNIVKAPVGKE